MMNYNLNHITAICLHTSFKILCVLGIIYLFTFSQVFASVSDTIYISQYDEKQEYNIADKILILEDSTRSLTIKEVIRASGFVKNTEGRVDFKVSESIYWIKFTIANTKPSQSKRNLLFTSMDIHELRFYHFDENNNLKRADTTGNTFNYEERSLYTRGFAFPLSLEPESTNTIYVYLDHRHQILSTDIKLMTDKKLLQVSTNDFFYSGLEIGTMILFMLIAISLLLFFRKAIHLNYLIYLTGGLIYFLSLNSGHRYIWNRWPYFQDPAQYIGPMILLFGFIGVFRLFFRLKEQNAFLDRFFQVLRLIALFLTIGFFFWEPLGRYYAMLYEIMGVLFIICSVSFIGVSFYIRKKDRRDRRQEYLWFITSMILMIATSSSILLIEQTSLDREDFEFVFAYLPEVTLYYESSILCFFLVRRVYREKLMYERKMLEERQHILEGLHDEVISGLAGIGMAFSNLMTEFEQIWFKAKLKTIRDRMSGILREIREITDGFGSRTKYLAQIIAEIRHFVSEQFEDQKTNLHFNFKIPEHKDIVLPVPLRRNLKGFLKEIVHNSAKYAKAENFLIEIEMKEKKLICFVCDDGTGFEYQKGIDRPSEGGNGLHNLRKKAERMKAVTYHYYTQPGKGVSIRVEIDFKQFNDPDYI